MCCNNKTVKKYAISSIEVIETIQHLFHKDDLAYYTNFLGKSNSEEVNINGKNYKRGTISLFKIQLNPTVGNDIQNSELLFSSSQGQADKIDLNELIKLTEGE